MFWLRSSHRSGASRRDSHIARDSKLMTTSSIGYLKLTETGYALWLQRVTRARAEGQIGDQALRAAVALAAHYGRSSKGAYMWPATLAERAGMHEDNTRRALKELARAGLLLEEPYPLAADKGRGRRRRFRFMLDAQQPAGAAASPQQPVAAGAQGPGAGATAPSSTAGVGASQTAGIGGSPASPTAEIGAAKLASSGVRTILNPCRTNANGDILAEGHRPQRPTTTTERDLRLNALPSDLHQMEAGPRTGVIPGNAIPGGHVVAAREGEASAWAAEGRPADASPGGVSPTGGSLAASSTLSADPLRSFPASGPPAATISPAAVAPVNGATAARPTAAAHGFTPPPASDVPMVVSAATTRHGVSQELFDDYCRWMRGQPLRRRRELLDSIRPYMGPQEPGLFERASSMLEELELSHGPEAGKRQLVEHLVRLWLAAEERRADEERRAAAERLGDKAIARLDELIREMQEGRL